MRSAQRPQDETSSRGPMATWRRRHLHARAIVAVIVLLGLLATELAAILEATV